MHLNHDCFGLRADNNAWRREGSGRKREDAFFAAESRQLGRQLACVSIKGFARARVETLRASMPMTVGDVLWMMHTVAQERQQKRGHPCPRSEGKETADRAEGKYDAQNEGA